MDLLLLSHGVGAVPDFLAVRVDRLAGRIRFGHLDDAAIPLSGAPFVAAEREHVAHRPERRAVVTVGGPADGPDLEDW